MPRYQWGTVALCAKAGSRSHQLVHRSGDTGTIGILYFIAKPQADGSKCGKMVALELFPEQHCNAFADHPVLTVIQPEGVEDDPVITLSNAGPDGWVALL